jgi:hypothetical protein
MLMTDFSRLAVAADIPARNAATIPTDGINFGGGFKTITTAVQQRARAVPTIKTEGLQFGHGPHIIHPPPVWGNVPRAAETIPTLGVNPGGVFETLPPPQATSVDSDEAASTDPATSL